MKVVIATNDKVTLNGHFALSKTFMFYDVWEDASTLVKQVDFTPEHQPHPECAPRQPFCVEERLEAIKGNDVVFVAAIGGPIAERVLENNVYPIEMNAPETIDTVLSKLQTLMNTDQPPWLKRILKHEYMLDRIEE